MATQTPQPDASPLQGAEATSDFPPVNWIPPRQGLIPPATIEGGMEVDGEPLYVARASYEGGIHPGKASQQKHKVYIGHGGKEIEFSLSDSAEVELLVGEQRAVRWVSIDGIFSLDQPGDVHLKPVPGGHDVDKKAFYMAQALMHNGKHCGKVKVGSTARITYGGLEEMVAVYQVLVYV